MRDLASLKFCIVNSSQILLKYSFILKTLFIFKFYSYEKVRLVYATSVWWCIFIHCSILRNVYVYVTHTSVIWKVFFNMSASVSTDSLSILYCSKAHIYSFILNNLNSVLKTFCKMRSLKLKFFFPDELLLRPLAYFTHCAISINQIFEYVHGKRQFTNKNTCSSSLALTWSLFCIIFRKYLYL